MGSDQSVDQPVSRRNFLRAGVAVVVAPVLQDSLGGRGTRGTLRDPAAAGPPRSPTDVRENDAEIQAIEQRLACNCGCTLDVFTCRTTDFSCTYSPALHREVLALRDSGKSAQEILDAFVDKYGEKALMAPKPRGLINLAGYFLPGVAILVAGAGLLLFIGRRRAAVSAVPGIRPGGSEPAASATPEELERLRRALDEIED